MGVEITFTDKQFPVSPIFVDFLHRFLNGLPFDTTWHDQLSEELVAANEELTQMADKHAFDVMQLPEGQKIIGRSYQLLAAFLTGEPEQLRVLHERYKFVCIVGVPRHGGSYLTKELFRSIGMEAEGVPNVVAHDGFPDLSPFDFAKGYNAMTNMQQNMAEYLAMVEAYFADSRIFNHLIVVPKKATKAAYHGAYFDKSLGPNSEYFITLRHPVSAAISTYEKSTGLPAGGTYLARGNIEEWAKRDNIYSGIPSDKIPTMDYFDVYLNYWEHYHYNLVLTGLRQNPNWTLVAYSKERMEACAAAFHKRFKSKRTPEEFKVFSNKDRHPAWMKKAEPAILRVRNMWAGVGLAFPAEEVMEAW